MVSSHAFLRLYSSLPTTDVGRARLLDGSTARGPFSYWRRVPTHELPPTHSRPFFAMEPETWVTSLAMDLLLQPPIRGTGDAVYCSTCAPVVPAAQAVIEPLDRHFSSVCGHGIRLPSTCHDPAVRALVAILDVIFGQRRVLAERDGDRRALDQFMTTSGAALLHRPDIVVVGMDGGASDSFVLIDIKTFDPAGASHRADDRTHRLRGGAHAAVHRQCLGEYGVLPPRMRLVPFCISTFGAIGQAAQRFLAELGRRAGSVVPAPLLGVATWATPTLAPLVRMAVGTAVRRGYAEAVCRHWRRAPRAEVPHFGRRGGDDGADGGGGGGDTGDGDYMGDDVCDVCDDECDDGSEAAGASDAAVGAPPGDVVCVPAACVAAAVWPGAVQ